MLRGLGIGGGWGCGSCDGAPRIGRAHMEGIRGPRGEGSRDLGRSVGGEVPTPRIPPQDPRIPSHDPPPRYRDPLPGFSPKIRGSTTSITPKLMGSPAGITHNNIACGHRGDGKLNIVTQKEACGRRAICKESFVKQTKRLRPSVICKQHHNNKKVPAAMGAATKETSECKQMDARGNGPPANNTL